MAKVIDTVAVKMIADVTGLQDGLGKIPKEVNEAARLVQSLASPTDMLIGKQARLNELKRMGAVTDEAYAVSLARIKSQMDDLNKTTDKNTVTMRDFGQELLSRIPGFGGFVGGAVTAGVVLGGLHQALGAVANAFRELQASSTRVDDIADSAERLGLSIEGISELKLAAMFGDVQDFGTVTGMIEKMQIKISEAHVSGSEAAKAFADIGINVRDIARLAPERQFELIAEKLSHVGNAGRQMELIQDTLGKSGNEARSLINNLDELIEKAKKSGGVLTQADAKAAAEVDEALKAANLSYEKFSNTAARGNAELLKDWYGIKETIWDAMRVLQTPRGEVGTRFEDWLLGGSENADVVEARALAAENRETSAMVDPSKELIKTQLEELEKLEAKARLAYELEILKEEEVKMTKEKSDLERLAAEESKARMEYELDMIRKIIKEDEEHYAVIKFAEQQQLSIRKELSEEASRIVESTLKPHQKAGIEVSQAEDLVQLGLLSQQDFMKFVTKQAYDVFEKTGQGVERNLTPKSFGSQEAIAATLTRKTETDSERLESIKQSLLQMSKKSPIEIKQVPKI